MKSPPPAAGMRRGLMHDHVAPSVARQRPRRRQTRGACPDDMDNRALHDPLVAPGRVRRGRQIADAKVRRHTIGRKASTLHCGACGQIKSPSRAKYRNAGRSKMPGGGRGYESSALRGWAARGGCAPVARSRNRCAAEAPVIRCEHGAILMAGAAVSTWGDAADRSLLWRAPVRWRAVSRRSRARCGRGVDQRAR